MLTVTRKGGELVTSHLAGLWPGPSIWPATMRCRFHDLRHYVATQLLGAGAIDLRTVSGRLGLRPHTDTKRTTSHPEVGGARSGTDEPVVDLGPAWIGVAGTAIGAIASTAGGYIAAKVRTKSDEARAETERRRAEQSYQVETLLELQHALARQMRACGAYRHLDLLHYRKTKEPWGKGPRDERWNIELQQMTIAVRLLTSRVYDDAVRSAVDSAEDAILIVAFARSEGESEQLMGVAQQLGGAALDAIGAAIRSLPPPTSYRPVVTTPFSTADAPEPPRPIDTEADQPVGDPLDEEPFNPPST